MINGNVTTIASSMYNPINCVSTTLSCSKSILLRSTRNSCCSSLVASSETVIPSIEAVLDNCAYNLSDSASFKLLLTGPL